MTVTDKRIKNSVALSTILKKARFAK